MYVRSQQCTHVHIGTCTFTCLFLRLPCTNYFTCQTECEVPCSIVCGVCCCIFCYNYVHEHVRNCVCTLYMCTVYGVCVYSSKLYIHLSFGFSSYIINRLHVSAYVRIFWIHVGDTKKHCNKWHGA